MMDSTITEGLWPAERRSRLQRRCPAQLSLMRFPLLSFAAVVFYLLQLSTLAFAGSTLVEAEDMELTDFRVRDNADASNGALIEAQRSGAQASAVFRGESGTYDVVVNYLDETDGVANLSLLIDGIEAESWALDSAAGSDMPNKASFTARTLARVDLERGNTVVLEGRPNVGDRARIDFIQFVPATVLYQAEGANLTPGFRINNTIPGFTGGGYVECFEEGVIDWLVIAPRSGDYSLEFRYADDAEAKGTEPLKKLDVFVNDAPTPSAEMVPFPETVVESRWLTQKVIVRLDAGPNTVALRTDATGGPSVDYVAVNPVKFLNARGSVAHAANPKKPEVGDADYSSSYYGRVDPAGERSTLEDWREINGFNDFPLSIASAEYINAFDLGFGREMFCLDNGRSSCYVQNSLDPKGASTLIATVAMERINYRGRSIVAFFVYDADGDRINQIALDSEGPKSVPESCYGCHGGFNHAGSPFGGQYLPWDIDLLEEWPGHPTLASQEGEFRRLNLLAWGDADRTDKANLETLVESWYGGPPFFGTTFDSTPFQTRADGESIEPRDESKSDWYTDPKGYLDINDRPRLNQFFSERYMYTGIYAKYCRSCHVAQVVDWATSRSFREQAYDQICGESNFAPYMSHAELTDDRFRNDVVNFTNGTSETAFESLCNEPPPEPIPPVGEMPDPVRGDGDFVGQGMDLFKNTAKGCEGCHRAGPNSDPNGLGSTAFTGTVRDVTCDGSSVVEDMSTISGSMNFTLTSGEVTRLRAYVDSFPGC